MYLFYFCITYELAFILQKMCSRFHLVLQVSVAFPTSLAYFHKLKQGYGADMMVTEVG